MAFYNDKENQDEDLIAQPNQSGGESASLSPGAPGAQASSTPSKQGNPGNFVGITNYLNANKNQASELGNQVGGVVSNSINDANTKIGEAGAKFGDYANQGAIAGLDNAGNDATNIVNKAANTGKVDETDTARFGQIANASYKGPKTLQDAQDLYNPAYESYTNAKNLSDLTKTEEGSQELTKKVANKDLQYTPGENRLDTYLLNTQENKQKLADARANAANLDPAFQGAQKQASDYATSLSDKTAAANKSARDLLSNTAMAKKAAVDQSLAQQQASVAANNAKIQQYRSLLSDPSDGGNLTLTPDQMQELGLTENERLYGALDTDPNAFLSGEQVFDPNAAISKDNQAQLAALAQLSSGYGGDFTNPYSMADLAGTANYNSKIDPSKLQQEIANREASYNKAYSNDKIRNGLGITNPGNPGYSPSEIENYYIPTYQNLLDQGRTAFAPLLNQYKDALASWKAAQNYNNVVKKK
jgi:hypothetical protein